MESVLVTPLSVVSFARAYATQSHRFVAEALAHPVYYKFDEAFVVTEDEMRSDPRLEFIHRHFSSRFPQPLSALPPREEAVRFVEECKEAVQRTETLTALFTVMSRRVAMQPDMMAADLLPRWLRLRDVVDHHLYESKIDLYVTGESYGLADFMWECRRGCMVWNIKPNDLVRRLLLRPMSRQHFEEVMIGTTVEDEETPLLTDHYGAEANTAFFQAAFDGTDDYGKPRAERIVTHVVYQLRATGDRLRATLENDIQLELNRLGNRARGRDAASFFAGRPIDVQLPDELLRRRDRYRRLENTIEDINWRSAPLRTWKQAMEPRVPPCQPRAPKLGEDLRGPSPMALWPGRNISLALKDAYLITRLLGHLHTVLLYTNKPGDVNMMYNYKIFDNVAPQFRRLEYFVKDYPLPREIREFGIFRVSAQTFAQHVKTTDDTVRRWVGLGVLRSCDDGDTLEVDSEGLRRLYFSCCLGHMLHVVQVDPEALAELVSPGQLAVL